MHYNVSHRQKAKGGGVSESSLTPTRCNIGNFGGGNKKPINGEKDM